MLLEYGSVLEWVYDCHLLPLIWKECHAMPQIHTLFFSSLQVLVLQKTNGCSWILIVSQHSLKIVEIVSNPMAYISPIILNEVPIANRDKVTAILHFTVILFLKCVFFRKKIGPKRVHKCLKVHLLTLIRRLNFLFGNDPISFYSKNPPYLSKRQQDLPKSTLRPCVLNTAFIIIWTLYWNIASFCNTKMPTIT